MSRFDDIAVRVVRDLMRDFGLDEESAAAIAGNIGTESAGFGTMQETNPVSGRGGYGWAQWTKFRRNQFEDFAAANGLRPTSYEANYGFLVHELRTTHQQAITAVTNAVGLPAKVRAFERAYEQAGTPHYASREGWARQALTAHRAAPPSAPSGLAPPVLKPPADVAELERRAMMTIGLLGFTGPNAVRDFQRMNGLPTDNHLGQFTAFTTTLPDLVRADGTTYHSPGMSLDEREARSRAKTKLAELERRNSLAEDHKAAQVALNAAGYAAGPETGQRKPIYVNALKYFQAENGLEAHGLIDGPTKAALGLLNRPDASLEARDEKALLPKPGAADVLPSRIDFARAASVVSSPAVHGPLPYAPTSGLTTAQEAAEEQARRDPGYHPSQPATRTPQEMRMQGPAAAGRTTPLLQMLPRLAPLVEEKWRGRRRLP